MNERHIQRLEAYARFHGTMQAVLQHIPDLVGDDPHPSLVSWIQQAVEAKQTLDNELEALSADAEVERLQAFADRNYERYHQFHAGERDDYSNIVEVSTDDFTVVHPWLSSCGRFKVDPMETYGGKALGEWIAQAKIALDAGL